MPGLGRLLGLLLSVVLLCGVTAAAPGTAFVPNPAAYLDEAIALIRQHALDRDRVDWPQVQARARRLAEGAVTVADTYPAIRHVIDALGNPHTFLIPSGADPAPDPNIIELPTARRLDDRIAVLTIPSVQADPAGERRYLDAGIAAVGSIDSAAVCGWIVDLRHNEGGNMWPMITVLAPLLGDGTIGSFVASDGTRTSWVLRDSRAMLGAQDTAARPNPVRLARPDPPVAVLTSEDTASAGEAALIAFRGLSRARTIGRPTAGFATANQAFPLSDGAVLILTTARDSDRTGRLYDTTPIEPDQLMAPRTSPADTVRAAQTWLRTHTRCRAT